jgi:hypothetical protein
MLGITSGTEEKGDARMATVATIPAAPRVSALRG